MSKNLPMCYEKEVCYFCNKLSCDKRIQNSIAINQVKNECDGNCYECKEAVRSRFYCYVYDIDGFGKSYRGCLMYHYITQIQSFEFYGREGVISDYSKIELAIFQLRKCKMCEEEKRFYKILKEISSKIKEIPHCFEDVTDLTSIKALSIAESSISQALKCDFECKIKNSLKTLIKECLLSNEGKKVDLNKLCEYINLNQTEIDYYIHPLTVNTILSEIEIDDCSTKI